MILQPAGPQKYALPATDGSKCVTESDPDEPQPIEASIPGQPDLRRPRGIRFSDSEWDEVKAAAQRHNIPLAEFVREKLLEIARGNSSVDSAATVAALAPLIERTFRYTWILDTHRRDELTQEGRADEIKELVAQARELQDRLQETDPH